MKKSFWIILVIVILLAVIALVFTFSNMLNETPNTVNDSTNSIILKMPVTEKIEPNNELSDHTILSYTQKTIQLNKEFSIDPSNIDFGECAPKIVFRLDGIQDDSITLSISEMQSMNGTIYSQGNSKEFLINDGNCVGVNTMCTDVSMYYCFEIKKDTQANIELYYSANLRGMMPFPTN